MYESIGKIQDYGMKEEKVRQVSLSEQICNMFYGMCAKDVSATIAEVKKQITNSLLTRREELVKEIEYIKNELDYLNPTHSMSSTRD